MKEIEIPEGYEAKIKGNKVIFEPKDSEDEKIRKQLINEVKEQINNIPAPDCCNSDDLKRLTILESWLAYLEKQKEQNLSHIEDVDYEENLDLAKNAIGMMRDGACYLNNRSRNEVLNWLKNVPKIIKQLTIRISELEKQKEQKLVGVEKVTHPLYVEGFEAGKEVGAQAEALKHIHTEWSEDIRNWKNIAYYVLKEWLGIGQYLDNPALDKIAEELQKRYGPVKHISISEWNEEDEEMLRIVSNRLDKFSEWATEQGFPIDDPTMKQSPTDWLKYLPKRLTLQPKLEWNEEDKKVLYEIIRNVSAYDAYTGTTYQQPERHDKKINFLRTLHPSWKPSEEQIRALEDVKMRMSLEGYGLCPLLQSLIDDLESL